MKFIIIYTFGMVITWICLTTLLVLRVREAGWEAYEPTIYHDCSMVFLSGLMWPITWILFVACVLFPAVVKFLAGV